jgi:hypothetical protein
MNDHSLTQRMYVRRVLLFGLMFISFGGWFLHLRIHPVLHDAANWIPFLAGIAGTVIIPLLFVFRKTLHYGYILNGLLVILGTITMAHYSLLNLPESFTPLDLLLRTTFGDIMILWCKFCAGKALFDLEVFGYDKEKKRSGVWWRYPNMGWWWIHAALVAAVYGAGALIWK